MSWCPAEPPGPGHGALRFGLDRLLAGEDWGEAYEAGPPEPFGLTRVALY